MTELIGHKDILSYFKNCAKNNTLSHAYSLIGPSSIGRMKLLEVFLVNFLPTDNLEHPDIKILAQEKDLISIDTIRNARTWLSHTPISSDKKVLIIDKAGAMNTEAQNAFLKILEEPGNATYIFLLLNNRKDVLQTIFSRALPIYFNPVPVSELQSSDVHGRPGVALSNNDHDSSLIEKILLSDNISERMRIWLEAKMEKEEIKSWLVQSMPELRKKLLSGTSDSQTTSKAIRNLLESFSKPIGQNWQLVAENLIVSI